MYKLVPYTKRHVTMLEEQVIDGVPTKVEMKYVQYERAFGLPVTKYPYRETANAVVGLLEFEVNTKRVMEGKPRLYFFVTPGFEPDSITERVAA